MGYTTYNSRAVGRKPSGSYNYRDIPDGLRRSASKMLHSVALPQSTDLSAGKIDLTPFIEDNTLVVFLSDNGGPTKELTSSNLPLSGGKGELREGGIRVPFIVSWKSRIPSGQVLDEPVVTIDISATALEIGRAQTGAKPLDGQSLIPWLTGQAKSLPDRALFWRVGKQHAVRSGDWKLMRSEQQWQLYNLARDIGEKNNLATQEPARVQQLSSVWEQWNAQQIAPLWSVVTRSANESSKP